MLISTVLFQTDVAGAKNTEFPLGLSCSCTTIFSKVLGISCHLFEIPSLSAGIIKGWRWSADKKLSLFISMDINFSFVVVVVNSFLTK